MENISSPLMPADLMLSDTNRTLRHEPFVVKTRFATRFARERRWPPRNGNLLYAGVSSFRLGGLYRRIKGSNVFV